MFPLESRFVGEDAGGVAGRPSRGLLTFLARSEAVFFFFLKQPPGVTIFPGMVLFRFSAFNPLTRLEPPSVIFIPPLGRSRPQAARAMGFFFF